MGELPEGHQWVVPEEGFHQSEEDHMDRLVHQHAEAYRPCSAAEEEPAGKECLLPSCSENGPMTDEPASCRSGTPAFG